MSSDLPTKPPQTPPTDAAHETRSQLPTAPAGTSHSQSNAVPPELADHSRYRVLRLLGAGGMGAVFHAEHRVMERPVALKVVRADLMGSPDAVERFRKEVKAAAQLHHPHIVTAFDAEQAGSTHFLVMEFVEGTDLATYIARKGPLPVAEACDYVRQASLGLQHAFEKGVNHRDIKPSNLMRTEGGTIKVMDFGLARFAGTVGEGQTVSGVILGTVDFMAPEQADNARTADIRSDIYSLGCTLFYLLTGRVLYPEGTMVQRVMAHVEKRPPSILDLRADVPERLSAVLGRMLAKDPRDRFQTPAEVSAALAPFAAAPVTSPITAVPPISDRRTRFDERDDEEFDPSRRRPEYQAHRGPLLLTLGILSILVAMGGFFVCAPIAFIALGLSVPAWVMSSKDLKAIKAGRIDPEGYSMTLGGYICAIIGSAAGILGGVCALVIMIVGGAMFVAPSMMR